VQSTELIAAAFGIFNALRLVSYLPQIVAVARDRHGAVAISLLTWSIWIAANASAALYAWINVGDLTLALVSAFNAFCCLVVFALAALKRVARWRRASAASALKRKRQTIGPDVLKVERAGS
jgi:hypothetical protein